MSVRRPAGRLRARPTQSPNMTVPGMCVAGAERAGLIVVSAVETSHPGYPDGADVVQLVARRPL